MKLHQIIEAVNNGDTVYWKNPLYTVVKDSKDQYFIHCQFNNNYVGLASLDGELQGEPEDFYIGDTKWKY